MERELHSGAWTVEQCLVAVHVQTNSASLVLVVTVASSNYSELDKSLQR